MFVKDTIFSGYTETPHIFSMDMYDKTMIKSAMSDLHPEIEKYISNVKPLPDKNILLIDALGAGEVWYDNVNGDYFPRAELMREDADAGYKSFMNHAFPYKHHRNEATKKDPNLRYGDRIPLSVYNKGMDRVQLIAIVDKRKAGDIVTSVDSGEYPDVSMACGVAYDKCSYCGSVHRVRKQYCNHCKDMLRKVMPNGQKVYLLNYRPRFHDISFVLIGADKQAKVLKKIASAQYQEPMQATGYDLTSLIAAVSPGFKRAAIEKNIKLQDVKVEKIAKQFGPGEVANYLEAMKQVQASELSIPPASLDFLSQYPAEDVVKTAAIMGIRLKPEELQYILLKQAGLQKEASFYYDTNQVFNPQVADHRSVGQGNYDRNIGYHLSFMVEDRSSHREFMAARLNKMAQSPYGIQKQAAPITSLTWPALGGMFQALQGSIPSTLQNVINVGAKAVSPYLTPLALGATYAMAANFGRELASSQPDDSFSMPDYQGNMMDSDYLDFGDKSAALRMTKSASTVPLIYLYASIMNKQAISNDFLSLLSSPEVINSLQVDRRILQRAVELGI